MLGYDTIQAWRSLPKSPNVLGVRSRSSALSALLSERFRVTASTSHDFHATPQIGPFESVGLVPSGNTTRRGSRRRTPEILLRPEGKSNASGLSNTSVGSAWGAATCTMGPMPQSSICTTETQPKKTSMSLSGVMRGSALGPSATSAIFSARTVTDLGILVGTESVRTLCAGYQR